MKKALIIFLMATLPFVARAQKDILRYEYAEGESYYTLELDTLGHDGQLCVHYFDREMLLRETVVFTLITLRINHRGDDEYITFRVLDYSVWDWYTDSWDWNLLLDEAKDIRNDFSLLYYIRNEWQRLACYSDDEMSFEGFYRRDREERNRFPFFRERDQIELYPPCFERVGKFDYDRFPTEVRGEIKRSRLRRK